MFIKNDRLHKRSEHQVEKEKSAMKIVNLQLLSMHEIFCKLLIKERKEIISAALASDFASFLW